MAKQKLTKEPIHIEFTNTGEVVALSPPESIVFLAMLQRPFDKLERYKWGNWISDNFEDTEQIKIYLKRQEMFENLMKAGLLVEERPDSNNYGFAYGPSVYSVNRKLLKSFSPVCPRSRI